MARKPKASVQVQGDGKVKEAVYVRKRKSKSRVSVQPDALVQSSGDMQEQGPHCSSAEATVKTVTTDINTEVIPLLDSIYFNSTLNASVTYALETNTSAWKLRISAENFSTALDACRGDESKCQKDVKYLEEQKVTITNEKYQACDEQANAAKFEFGMPEPTHSVKTCDFAAHGEPSDAPEKCWDTAYLAALKEIESSVEAAEETWKAAKDSCNEWTKKLEDKILEIIYKKDDCDNLKAKCNKIEQNKDTTYCAFQGAISDLCEASDELSTVWELLKSKREKKIAAIRTMKITSCMYSDHYSLGDSYCEGCKFGSLSSCEATYPEDGDYGVDIATPPAVDAIAGLFGLPSSTAAEAWCKLEEMGSSASISFPGHLWTRDASGMLARDKAPEATTLPKICV